MLADQYCCAVPYNNCDDQFLGQVAEVSEMIQLPQSSEDDDLLF